MNFTILEKNIIHDILGQQKMADIKSLELLLDLRKKFIIPAENQDKWLRFKRLSLLDNRSEKQQEFWVPYKEELVSGSVDIDLTKKEFEFLYSKLISNSALPSTLELLEHSIDFKHKLKEIKNDEEKI